MTTLITSIAGMRAARAELSGTVALVPTMGALHDGHLSLIRLARQHAEHIIVSVFVNPLQFGPNEDFDRYPRDLHADLAAVEGLADLVFAPTTEEMYPLPDPFRVDVGPIGSVLEGAARPGHFSGVATVVLKLLTIISPDLAVFGQKDAQQLTVVRRLVADFNLPVAIIPAPIIREETGLARSSRNAYLSEQGRRDALTLSHLLRDLQHHAMPAADLRIFLSALADTEAVQWDYAEALDAETFQPISSDFIGEALVVCAARVDGVRLLDNAFVNVSTPAGER